MAQGPLNAHGRIKAAMRQKERDVIAHMRSLTGVYRPGFLLERSWRHAIERLEKCGRIRWAKQRGGYIEVDLSGRKHR